MTENLKYLIVIVWFLPCETVWLTEITFMHGVKMLIKWVLITFYIKFNYFAKMKLIYLSKLHFTVLWLLLTISDGQIINRAPQFVPGSGDMARFSLPENTPIGHPIYQLRGKIFFFRLFLFLFK